MKINFLLGSGVSIPAKLPGVGEITQRVLSGRPRRVIDRIQTPLDYQIESEKRETALAREFPILRFLERLKVHAHRRFEQMGMREANYEDLAYLAGQIHDDFLGNRENPALLPFIESLIEDLDAVLQGVGLPENASSHERLGKVAGQAVDYIHDVVAGMLLRTPSDTDYLRFFADAIRDDQVAEVNLFTLNHDTLLETYLRRMQPAINLTDGFGEADVDGIRRWNAALYDKASGETGRPAVRLFKLHGSIDWCWRTPQSNRNDPRNPWADEFIGVRPLMSENAAGRPQTEARGRPLFLAGTMNKDVSYTVTPFLDLHYRFHRALGESEHLIVIGYSFGDKGVNQRLSEWMGSSRTRRMLVIDPKSCDVLKDTARSPTRVSIAGQIDNWGPQRFDHWSINFGANDCTWSAAKRRFFVSGQGTG